MNLALIGKVRPELGRVRSWPVYVQDKRQKTQQHPPEEVQQDDLSKRQEFGERTSCRNPCCSYVLLPNLHPFSEGILPNPPNCRTKTLNSEKNYLAQTWNEGSPAQMQCKNWMDCRDQNFSGSGKRFQELLLKNYWFYCGIGSVWNFLLRLVCVAYGKSGLVFVLTVEIAVAPVQNLRLVFSAHGSPSGIGFGLFFVAYGSPTVRKKDEPEAKRPQL